jgi:hypothetical protein
MRWGKPCYQPQEYERHLITRFAWLPIRIKGETRWLEKYCIRAYFWFGSVSGRKYWEYEEFVDEG